MPNFSDYIVYVDESGDHSLTSIDKNFPVFVLSLCVFHKKYYANEFIPKLQALKFKYFGHDYIILHEREIRKEIGIFKFINKEEKMIFMNDLTNIIESTNFILIGCVINKNQLTQRYSIPDNPYNIAMKLCLERLYNFLSEKNQTDSKTHIIVENRGKKEDKELELEFRRIIDKNNWHKKNYNFEMVFMDKKSNSSGLQLADLTARPIGVKMFNKNKPNRAYDILTKKFYCKGGRDKCGENFYGFGLKEFP